MPSHRPLGEVSAPGFTGLGVLSLVLTYVFQEPLQGLFSGTYLALDRSFEPGDLIVTEADLFYRVQQIGTRVTQLYDVNRHTHVYLPNAKLIAEKVNVADERRAAQRSDGRDRNAS